MPAEHRSNAWLLTGLPLPCGLIILLFNDRFTSPAWRVAAAAPGGYNLWGGVLLVCGVVMLARMLLPTVLNDKLYFVCLAAVAMWWVILGSLSLIAAVHSHANPLGAVVWPWIGAWYWNAARYQRQRLQVKGTDDG